MKKTSLMLILAVIIGAGCGALLGYGPLLRYKSEGVLSMDLGTSEYKRFTELANDTDSMMQYLRKSPPSQMQAHEFSSFVKKIVKNEWYKPIPKVNKADAKELPEIVLQLEREREKEKERELEQGKDFNKNKKIDIYLGLKFAYTSSDPHEAAAITTWLGDYFKEVATREAVREQVSQWSSDNLQFSDRALEQKLKYEFEIQQHKAKVVGFKKILSNYPATNKHEISQVVDVRKDNEKFISPTAQLVGSESEIINITGKILKLDREIEQQKFATNLLEDAKASIVQAQYGTESVSRLAGTLIKFSKNVKTDAEREKLLYYTAGLSQISARFLSQAQFIAQPSVPTQPERPSPSMIIIFMSIIFFLIALIYIKREFILNKLNT